MFHISIFFICAFIYIIPNIIKWAVLKSLLSIDSSSFIFSFKSLLSVPYDFLCNFSVTLQSKNPLSPWDLSLKRVILFFQQFSSLINSIFFNFSFLTSNKIIIINLPYFNIVFFFQTLLEIYFTFDICERILEKNPKKYFAYIYLFL